MMFCKLARAARSLFTVLIAAAALAGQANVAHATIEVIPADDYAQNFRDGTWHRGDEGSVQGIESLSSGSNQGTPADSGAFSGSGDPGSSGNTDSSGDPGSTMGGTQDDSGSDAGAGGWGGGGSASDGVDGGF